jgi:short-subunit dehydrogenase involved in D-alanine esterification of teichoic acids
LFSLEGRAALITGGSRGMGKMIAKGFLAYGARVYISSRAGDYVVGSTLIVDGGVTHARS